MNANVSTSDVINASNACEAFAARVFTSAQNEENAASTTAAIILAALAPFAETPTSLAYVHTYNAMRAAYVEARLSARLGLARDKARDILSLRNYNKDKDGQAGMRSKSQHDACRAANEAWGAMCRSFGFVSTDSRGGANNTKTAGKDARAPRPTTVPADAPAIDAKGDLAPNAGDAPVFTKDYDGFARLQAIASELSKAMRQNPKGFKRGAFACASDVIALIDAMVKAEAGDADKASDETIMAAALTAAVNVKSAKGTAKAPKAANA